MGHDFFFSKKKNVGLFYKYKSTMLSAQKQLRTCSDSPLAKVFFSQSNLEKIHGMIIQAIFSQLNVQIGKQSHDDVLNVAVHAYEHFANSHATNINCEVSRLNMIVVDRCVQSMRPNILHYINYVNNLDKPPELMARPKNTSSKGIVPMFGQI